MYGLQRRVTCNQSKYIMRGHSNNSNNLSGFKGKNQNGPCPVCVLIILWKLNFCAFQLKFSCQIINKTPLSALLKAFIYLEKLRQPSRKIDLISQEIEIISPKNDFIYLLHHTRSIQT